MSAPWGALSPTVEKAVTLFFLVHLPCHLIGRSPPPSSSLPLVSHPVVGLFTGLLLRCVCLSWRPCVLLTVIVPVTEWTSLTILDGMRGSPFYI